MSEGEEMLSIKVDKRPISQAQLIVAATGLLFQAFVAGGLYYKFTNDIANAASKGDLAVLSIKVDTQEAARQARSVMSDRNFDDIQKQLKPLDTVVLRLDQNDKRDDAQDARIDKMLESIGAKLDGIGERVNGLSTKVEVLSQKIDAITPSKKAELGLPPELVR